MSDEWIQRFGVHVDTGGKHWGKRKSSALDADGLVCGLARSDNLGKFVYAGGLDDFDNNVIHQVNQVHGVDIQAACEETGKNDVPKSRPVADGIYTRELGVAVGIRTADCLPLIICSRENRFLCAVHVGWRGLVRGMVIQALACSRSLGIRVHELVAYIGPCIGPEAFELGPEVKSAFDASEQLGDRNELAACWHAGKGDRLHLDLQRAVATGLVAEGLKNLVLLRDCTLSSGWPSYRQERRKGKAISADCILSWAYLLA